MKRGRGGDSLAALRAIWMEGYNCALQMIGHPDACEHGVRLKNHCATCAAMVGAERCPCCGVLGNCPCLIYDFEGSSNETGPWSEKRCIFHRCRV